VVVYVMMMCGDSGLKVIDGVTPDANVYVQEDDQRGEHASNAHVNDTYV
jgi:hypothetical protein